MFVTNGLASNQTLETINLLAYDDSCWVLPRVGCKGEFLVVSGHWVIDSLLVGSGCLFLVGCPSFIHEKHV